MFYFSLSSYPVLSWEHLLWQEVTSDTGKQGSGLILTCVPCETQGACARRFVNKRLAEAAGVHGGPTARSVRSRFAEESEIWKAEEVPPLCELSPFQGILPSPRNERKPNSSLSQRRYRRSD